MRVLNASSVFARPKLLILEMPHRMIGGGAMRIEDIRATSALARKLGVHLHLDGRLIFDALPHYALPLHEICELVDSVCIGFDDSRGPGVVPGAMLLGTADFIDEARRWRLRLGAQLLSFFPM